MALPGNKAARNALKLACRHGFQLVLLLDAILLLALGTHLLFRLYLLGKTACRHGLTVECQPAVAKWKEPSLRESGNTRQSTVREKKCA